MRSGVSFPSYAANPTYAMITGAADALYPVANLADLYNIRAPFKASAAGVVAFSGVFTATKAVQFLALLHHNGAAADTIRVRLYSDAGMTSVVYDSTAISLFPTGSAPNSLYPQCFPLRLSAATNARAFRIDLSANALPWVIGGLEISGFWQWTDVAVPREIGFQNTDVIVAQPFGVDHAMSQYGPRTISGSRDVTDQSENLSTAMDFQLATKTNKPFVWCWDVDDATTYPREVVLVRNAKLNPTVQNEYPSGKQSFAFLEHLR